MQLTHVLTLGLFALGVSALPGQQPSGGCPGGQCWNDGQNKCECPPDQNWNPSKNKCCYEPMPQPQCPPPQQCWCSQNQNNWCEYDQNNDYCENNGQNSVKCCDKDQDWGECMNQWYPPTMPKCPDIQQWCASSQQCECPQPMQWQNNKCQWPPMPKPNCPWGQQPWCGKSKSQYCQWDANNEWCQNDGSCYTWCGMESDIWQQIESIFSIL